MFDYFKHADNRAHFDAIGKVAKVGADIVQRVWESFAALSGPEQMLSYFRYLQN